MLVLASSGGIALAAAFGVGFVAIAVLLGGLLAMLEGDDRRALVALLRHPVRSVSGTTEGSEDSSG